jgi:hypothetical protein
MPPGAEHYREIAGMLREAARWCRFAGARKEVLHLAQRFESRADYLDRRPDEVDRDARAPAAPPVGAPQAGSAPSREGNGARDSGRMRRSTALSVRRPVRYSAGPDCS